MTVSKKICVGQIISSHGVRGLVKVRSFTEDPLALEKYTPLTDEKGTAFRLTLQSTVKDQWIARIDGVSNRDQSEALRGTKLYVDRSLLPPSPEGTYYHTDLIGLEAHLRDQTRLGHVLAVHNYGAGTFLEIRLTDGSATEMLPFTNACVPTVNITEGFLIVHPPDGWLDKPTIEKE